MPGEITCRDGAHAAARAKPAAPQATDDPLFGDVHLVHQAVPALAAGDVDTRCTFMGKSLALPLVVTGTSGGTERSRRLNRALAGVAEEAGIAFAFGSQRATLEDLARAPRFRVRSAAPRAVVVANVGLWQAHKLGVDGVRRLMDAIEADGVAVQLESGQELDVSAGDRDVRGGLDVLGALAAALGERLVVRETGCGLGPATTRCLLGVGVRTVDVSGLGGTSLLKVGMRSERRARAAWGIPTAASVHSVARLAQGRAAVIASGGIRDGLGAATALALGASLVGVALPLVRALEAGGTSCARDKVAELGAGLRLAMTLTGAPSLAALDATRVVVGPRLKAWIEELAQP